MNSGLGDRNERTECHLKPTKSQVKTVLRYNPVTFFWQADDFKIAFK